MSRSSAVQCSLNALQEMQRRRETTRKNILNFFFLKFNLNALFNTFGYIAVHIICFFAHCATYSAFFELISSLHIIFPWTYQTNVRTYVRDECTISKFSKFILVFVILMEEMIEIVIKCNIVVQIFSLFQVNAYEYMNAVEIEAV